MHDACVPLSTNIYLRTSVYTTRYRYINLLTDVLKDACVTLNKLGPQNVGFVGFVASH